jgi:tripartite-type tricarboxylate transporter receptor subunit TctC
MGERRYKSVIGLTVAALLLAACGGDAEEEPADPGGEETETEEETNTEGEETETEEEDAESASPASCEGPLEPLDSGFPSEPITLLVVDEAGSADGIMARAVQRSLAKFSPVSINIVDRPDFGKFGNYEAAEWMGDQPGGNEGYIAGVIIEPGGITDLIATDVMAALGSSEMTFNYVIAVEQTPYAFYTAVDRPWGDDINAFVEYALDNPGELVYMANGGGSGVDIATADYMTRLGIEHQTIVGGSFAETAAAIAAGEADFATVGTVIIDQFQQDGRVVSLALSQDGPPVEGLGSPPRMKEITGQEVDPWGRTSGFFVTEETPDEHRDWLFEAMRCVTEDPEFIESRESIAGNKVVALNHDEYFEVAGAGYTAAFPILDAQGLRHPTVEEPIAFE